MYDVAIIGCGPVGALAANLLGKAGVKTLVVEREAVPYPLPRAVHLDHEMMRLFQSAGVIADVLPDMRDTDGHLHVGADHGMIRYMGTVGKPRPFGWSNDYFFYQPELEEHLRGALRRFPNVELRLGTAFSGLRQDADNVTLQLGGEGGPSEVEARYVIACDGSRSSVRKALGIALDDLDFEEPWLVVDAEVEGAVRFPDLHDVPPAANLQTLSVMMCDPRRPATVVPGRGNHRRWEFMLLPGEDDQEMMGPDKVAELVGPYLAGVPHTIVRAATYRFHGLIAEQWQTGRVFLAGDAAHQTPPFFGQGMCHGLRDVANLAWKLEHVLGGGDPALLDDAVGGGWRLFIDGKPSQTGIGGVSVRSIDAAALADGGAVREWLSARHVPAVLVRPDHYVFGTGEPAALLRQLGERLLNPAATSKEQVHAHA